MDFNAVSTVGLESSPVADAVGGLRPNEARFVKHKWDHVFKTRSLVDTARDSPAEMSPGDRVHTAVAMVGTRPHSAHTACMEPPGRSRTTFESPMARDRDGINLDR